MEIRCQPYLAGESGMRRTQVSSVNQPRASWFDKNACSKDLHPHWLAQREMSEKTDLGNHVIRQWLAKYYSYYSEVKG